MDKQDTHPLPPIAALQALAANAAKAILDIYYDETLISQVTFKQDASPLTLADKASHAILVEGLKTLTPDIPVMSEESAVLPYEERKHWEYFWCIDPLDGTKEFLQRSDEFTINIALVHHQQPVFGMIYVPVQRSCYYGSSREGTWRITSNGSPVRLHADNQAKDWTALGSRFHSSPEEQEMVKQYPISKTIAAGSALKFCLIAEGKAHFYYRHGPTMEWDTAAGQALVQFSGGKFTHPGGGAFLYNKESPLNGSFICSIDPSKEYTP
ncbi:3'(2'),5'-bisphosphate nucleotidase CysQ [Puia dinghuensis]|uniref:3'(2'),5'-bisphosphate nucleotidase CysQ n=1 Tax=Puia dinghuensis TaxID=1792502 RepID=A0A8J2UBT8_9BACT|nr:3'(2'),5'-bisphosphate nucleotidase CysQ [Puia dinghuensis]GGA93740.1 3'(2'),5'-bisphosphate nucleotidase CysQ [Puia dinghuensis]